MKLTRKAAVATPRPTARVDAISIERSSRNKFKVEVIQGDSPTWLGEVTLGEEGRPSSEIKTRTAASTFELAPAESKNFYFSISIFSPTFR
jgi:hypothetical protein